MTFYPGLAATASRLLKDKGQTATWLHSNGDATFNPVTGFDSGGTTKSYEADGVLLDFQSNRIDGSSILTTDKRFLMNTANKPEVNDTFTINKTVYQVISIKETNPAGTPVIYEVQLRT
jgi:hypothetical protein